MRYILPRDKIIAHRAIDAAPDGYTCDIKERTRTADQNAALHAMLTDIARQREWVGRKLSVDDWKAIMVSGHRTLMGQSGDIVPGIEGEFVQLRKSTAAMGIKELGSLLDYMAAWCAENEIRLSAPAYLRDMAA